MAEAVLIDRLRCGGGLDSKRLIVEYGLVQLCRVGIKPGLGRPEGKDSNVVLPIGRGILIAAGLTVLGSVPARAEDPSVARRLDAENLAYNVDKDGDYRATFSYSSENRTQLVFVSGRTETISGVKIREIFSPAADMKADGVSGTKAIALMEKSGGQKVGAWEIRNGTLYYVIKYPEPMSAILLHELMNSAATAADNMEIEISGSKDAL